VPTFLLLRYTSDWRWFDRTTTSPWYTAHINADNPNGTMQSIEHTLRALDKTAEDERRQVDRLEKTLTDYQAQANRPFEHDARLKELLASQAKLNAALDLDKSDAQAAEPAAVELVTETAIAGIRSQAAAISPGPERNSATVPRH